LTTLIVNVNYVLTAVYLYNRLNQGGPVDKARVKDDVHSCAHARTLFTFWTAIFVEYDILTEYLTLFWFAILVNEYKLYVSIQKSSKDAKYGQCLFWGSPFVMSRTDAQNGVDIIFKRQFFSMSRICNEKCSKPKIFLASLSKLLCFSFIL
jgi:hypothetical protein